MPATINSLATETISEIFSHAFHSQSNEDWCSKTLPSLRLVSRRWNATVESYRELWTHVFISERSAHFSGQSLFQSTHSRLLRSRGLPLDITIQLPMEISSHIFDIQEAEALGKMIKTVASRVKHFEISGQNFSLERAVLRELGETAMPLLCSFIYCGSQDPQLVSYNADVDELPTSLVEKQSYLLQHESDDVDIDSRNEWGDELYPTLDHIEILGGHFQWYRLPIPHKIRHLCLHGSGIEVVPFLDLLEDVTGSLRVLEVTDVLCLEPGSYNHWRDNVMVFEYLEILSLGFVHMEAPLRFFDGTYLFGLKDLTLRDMSRDCDTYDYEFPHHELLTCLIQCVHLSQLDRLVLNGVVFPNEDNHKVEIPRPGTELSAERLEHIAVALHLPEEEFAPICGHWTMPLAVFFLHKLSGLKHLSLENVTCNDGTTNVLKMLGRYWQQGTLATLETLYFDGNPDGVLDLLSAIEKEKVAGFRRLPLRVTVGERLKSMMSEEEQSELERYTKVLGKV